MRQNYYITLSCINALLIILQPTDIESFDESDEDGSEYSEASEDSDSEGINLHLNLFEINNLETTF